MAEILAAAPPAAPVPPAQAATPPIAVPPVTPPAPPVVPPVAAAPVVPPVPPVVPPAPIAPPVAPVSYALTLPATGDLDQTDVTAVAALATTRGWTNEEAQGALNELATGVAAQRAAFRTELSAHPEIGGTNLAVAQQNVARALDRFLPASLPEGAALRTAMNKSGYGDYAPLVLLLSRIGKSMAEDRPLTDGSLPPGGDRRPTADVMFPSTAPKA